jgi:lipopolysaccharide/colanic/teichoic acid biosynthesis glycosyltransferase
MARRNAEPRQPMPQSFWEAQDRLWGRHAARPVAGERDGMTRQDFVVKRLFDIVVSAAALLLLWPLIGIAWFLAGRNTDESGMFTQQRVGRHGKLFTIYKIRTMRKNSGTSVTTLNDARITSLGRYLRRLKIDELPQLWNVLRGDMSLVGPRPDVPGYMDALQGQNQILLELRPGITGPATLKYRDEEKFIGDAEDPEKFNDEVIWPDKVRINMEYMHDYSFARDIRYLLATVHLVDHGVS